MLNGLLEINSKEEEIIKTFPNILTTSNCLHIALLVYLRFVAITKPLQYENIHRKHHIKSPILIWFISIIVNILSPISLCFGTEVLNFFVVLFILHGFHTIPIVSIIITYVRMIKSINKTNEERVRLSEFTDKNEIASSRISTSMIKGVSICLIVCYLPYLFWFQYVRIKQWIHSESDITNVSSLEVRNYINLNSNFIYQ